MLKKIAPIMVIGLLSACSSIEDQNKGMVLDGLQNQVDKQDEQWKNVQIQLDRIDELEAEIVSLKQDKTSASVDKKSTVSIKNAIPVLVPSDKNISNGIEPVIKPSMITPVSNSFVYGVQIASYVSRAEAIRGWNIFLSVEPITFDAVVPLINKIEINKRLMYQLKVGPYLDNSFALEFCSSLKEKGIKCFITKYNGDPFVAN